MVKFLTSIKFLVLIGFLIGFLAAIIFSLISTPRNLPKTKDNQVAGISTSKSKQVIGFFPYWNLSKVNDVDLSSVTTIYYFALDLNGDGTFNQKDPGWSNLNSRQYQLLKTRALKSRIRWGLTIVNLDQDSITKNINNPLRQETIIANTLALMKKEGFQDLNIDLEYVGDPDPNLTSAFTHFVQLLTDRVHQEIPNSQVSLDAFADSVIKPRIFDMKSLGQIVDQIIIMAYDIHRLNSPKAGPISPLFGKGKYEYDVTTSLNDYLTKVSPSKLLLGVPFYGYEWPTQDNTLGSFVINSPHGPEISSYHRSLETAQDHKASVNFDEDSKSVWFPYFDPDSATWRQVWFENERSLGLKFDLVNQASLSGIAIFALGYDGKDAAPLWDEVRLKLK